MKKILWSSVCVMMMMVGSSFAETGYSERDEQQEIVIRQLTGEVESLKFQNGELKKSLEALKSQMDLRLNMLESSSTQEGASNSDTNTEGETPSVKKEVKETEVKAEKKPTKETVEPAQTLSLYESAKASLDKKDYLNAQKSFSEFVEKYPTDKLAPNAAYWLGETYYAQKDYHKAALKFLAAKKQYSDSPKAGHSLYKLGMSLHFLGENKEACLTFDEVEKNYVPKDGSLTSLVEKARKTASCK